MPYNHIMAASLYILSGFLDAFDGMAARAFNQSNEMICSMKLIDYLTDNLYLGSKFGAMLDMLTDRCATMCLYATLCSFYPSYLFFFQIVMICDVSCHWIHLHTSNVLGKGSHKTITEEENALLRFYYTNKPFLFFMCAGNELFYSMLYLLHFTYGFTSNSQSHDWIFSKELTYFFLLFSSRCEYDQAASHRTFPCRHLESCASRHARGTGVEESWLHRHC